MKREDSMNDADRGSERMTKAMKVRYIQTGEADKETGIPFIRRIEDRQCEFCGVWFRGYSDEDDCGACPIDSER
jgi:hypothetical protein